MALLAMFLGGAALGIAAGVLIGWRLSQRAIRAQTTEMLDEIERRCITSVPPHNQPEAAEPRGTMWE